MSLPKEVENFCKEVAKLAIENNVKDFELIINHDGHWDEIKARWEGGTHGRQSNRMHIVTTEHLHTTLDGKDFYA